MKLVAGGTATAVVGIAAWLLGTAPGRTFLGTLTVPPPQRLREITFNANGKPATLRVKANSTLLSVLRSDLNLTGTKPGCSNSECGACTVLLDGTPVYSCHKLAVEAEGHQVTTIEGVTPEAGLSTLQQAFASEGAFQCGFCTSGFIVTASALLKSSPNPTDMEVRQALSGNICRCGSYPHIINAVKVAAAATATAGGGA